MARKKRICVPGALHHVTSKVVKDKSLFKDEADLKKFNELMQQYLKSTGFVLYSLNMSSDHYHMLIRLNNKPLSALCRAMHSEYALYYNRKYKVDGYFFQGRPKAVPVEEGEMAHEIMGYTNSGPIRADQCKTLEDLDIYPWGSHAVVMNSPNNFPFLKSEDVLSVFDDNDGNDPKKIYCEVIRKWSEKRDGISDFIKKIKPSNQDRQDMYKPWYWAIGSRKFVKDAIEEDDQRRARLAVHKLLGWDEDDLAKYVCSLTSVSLSDLTRRGRMNSISEARKLFCYFAVRVLEMTTAQTAKRLHITRTAVTFMAKQGEKIALEKKLELPLNPL